MPKVQRTKANLLLKYVSDYKDVFKTDGNVLFCKVCNKSVTFTTKFQVDQHLESLKHKDFYDRATQKVSQPLISSKSAFGDKTSVFSLELCDALVSAPVRPYLRKHHLEKLILTSCTLSNYVR